jgi:hypothetical protein
MGNPHSDWLSTLEERVKQLESRLAKMETVVKVENTSVGIRSTGEVRIQAGGEVRIQAGKVRIDGPGGVDIQPLLRTSILKASYIEGAHSIDVGKVNGVRIIRIPPFIVPI